MIKLEIDDKVYKIPESFDELDFETYCRVFFKLDSIVSEDEADSFKKGVEAESAITAAVSNKAS